MPRTIAPEERLDEEIRIRVTKSEKNYYDNLAKSYSFRTGTFCRSVLRRTMPDFDRNRFFA